MIRHAGPCAIAVALLSLSVGACSKKSSEDKDKAENKTKTAKPEKQPDKVLAQPRWYLMKATMPSKEIDDAVPFYVQVPAQGSQDPVRVRSGDADVLGQPTWNGSELTVEFAPMKASFKLSIMGGGKNIMGTWVSTSQAWGKAKLKLRGTAVDKPEPAKLFDLPGDQDDSILGTWRMSDGDAEVKLVIERAPDGGVFASYATALGNTTRMGGVATATELRLASFDATLGVILEGELDGEELVATRLAVRHLVITEQLAGKRESDFELATSARVVEGETQLVIPNVDMAKFKGKPLIVELAASWCANCRYAVPFMKKMHETYKAQGLQITTLLYEFTEDAAYNKSQEAAYKKQYQVPWDVTAIGGTFEKAGEVMPQTVEGLDLSGLPVAIFVKPDGSIHDIHSGFPAETLSTYKQATENYENAIKAIVGAAQ